MNFESSLEIALLIVVALILIALGVEALDIYETSRNRSYIVRTIGFLLLVSGTKIFISLAEMYIIPSSVRKNIRTLYRNAF